MKVFYRDLIHSGKCSQSDCRSNASLLCRRIQISTGKSFGGAQTNSGSDHHSKSIYRWRISRVLGSNASGWGFSGSITACYYLGKQAGEDIAEHYSDDVFHPIYALQRERENQQHQSKGLVSLVTAKVNKIVPLDYTLTK